MLVLLLNIVDHIGLILVEFLEFLLDLVPDQVDGLLPLLVLLDLVKFLYHPSAFLVLDNQIV